MSVRNILFAVLIAVAVAATTARVIAADGDEWPVVGRTHEEQYYSPLDKINVDTVQRLGLAWYHDWGTRRGIEATPLMVDGVLYTTLPWNVTHAIDARTGKVLWTYDPEVPRQIGRIACCDIVTRGLSIADGKVIIATLDGRLIALDAKTGKPIWTTQTLEPGWPYTVTGAPRVYDGKVLIGNGGADYGVRGYVSAYDLKSGKMVWRFYTVPGDPKKGFENKAMEMAAKTWNGEWWKLGGGGTAWDAIVYDPQLKMVYIGTGNGSPWIQKFRSPGGGDNLFLASIVALKIETGEYVWHYQQIPGEHFDYAATQPIVQADLTIDGKPRQVLMQIPKSGFFYVLDRKTGELLSAKNIPPVTWASGYDMKTGRPIFTKEADFGETPVVLGPAFMGAHNWYPMAFSPKTGLVYVPVAESYGVYSAANEFTPRTVPGLMNTGTGSGSGVPQERIELQDKAVAQAKYWLSAWDPVHQKEVWRVDYPAKNSGGTLATGGNLVFQGTSNRTFAAYRADNGAKVWEMPVDQISVAAPMTYMLDGEQYIALNAGYGGGLAHSEASAGRGPHISTGRLMVFKLGGDAKLPPLPPEDIRPPPKVTMTDEEMGQGRQLYVDFCEACHGTSVRGGVKDLRFMDEPTRKQFNDIVLKGTKQSQGMVGFGDVLQERDMGPLLNYIMLRAYEDYGSGDAPVPTQAQQAK